MLVPCGSLTTAVSASEHYRLLVRAVTGGASAGPGGEPAAAIQERGTNRSRQGHERHESPVDRRSGHAQVARRGHREQRLTGLAITNMPFAPFIPFWAVCDSYMSMLA